MSGLVASGLGIALGAIVVYLMHYFSFEQRWKREDERLRRDGDDNLAYQNRRAAAKLEERV